MEFKDEDIWRFNDQEVGGMAVDPVMDAASDCASCMHDNECGVVTMGVKRKRPRSPSARGRVGSSHVEGVTGARWPGREEQARHLGGREGDSTKVRW